MRGCAKPMTGGQPTYCLHSTLQWIDTCTQHASKNPDSRLHRIGRNADGSFGSTGDYDPTWRSTLAANRDACLHLPSPWRRIYWDAVLVMFDHDPTVRAIEVGERHACVHARWTDTKGMNVDVLMEMRSRSTCPICGSPARTVARQSGPAVTRCRAHLHSVV